MPARDVSPAEAEPLVASGAVRVLDVRTPQEHRDLGHIPGSLLLPVDLIAAAPATLPREGLPLLVYCEHGVRSLSAVRRLARAGYDVLNLAGGMSHWRGPREFGPGEVAGVSSWLLACADLLPQGGAALDVACGRGRHALLLASVGFRVRAVDRDAAKVTALRSDAASLGLELSAEVVDLEAGEPDIGGGFDLVLVVHYLHRPLAPVLVKALAPGGLLLYETFTVDQAQRGHPKNPDFLLQHGELPRLFTDLELLRERDGEFEGRSVAAIAARAPQASGSRISFVGLNPSSS